MGGFARLFALLAMLLAAPLPGLTQEITVSREQALVLAQQALKSGDAELANQIARRILAQDPDDPLALLIIAATGPDLGHARIGRLSGGAAWRNARHLPAALRYEIARHTARAAMVEGRPAFAEVWLRRAIDTAPDHQTRDRSQIDLANLRASRPLSLRFSGSITPSSNVNSGSGGSQFLIDGIHLLGPISSTGQELSGLRANATAELSFGRVKRSQSQTEFGLALHLNRFWLSAEAQAKVDQDPMLAGQPRFTGADLNSTVIEGRFQYSVALPGSKSPARFALSASQTWLAQEARPSLALAATLPLLANQTSGLEIGINARRQWHLSGAPTDLVVFRLAGRTQVGPGNFSYSLAVSHQIRPGDVNSTFNEVQVELGYQMAQTGPLRLGGGLFFVGHDQDYQLFPNAYVTNGRHDRRAGLSLSVGLPEMTLMGLEPTITATAQRNFSNLSRFDTRELALGLGLAARF